MKDEGNLVVELHNRMAQFYRAYTAYTGMDSDMIGEQNALDRLREAEQLAHVLNAEIAYQQYQAARAAIRSTP